MKYLILAILGVAVASAVQASDYNCRRVSFSRGKQLYYYSNGYWYHYNGGNYGQLYYWDGYKYCEYEVIVLVPKAIEVEVHRDHYFSIDTAAQQNLLADAIAYRVLLAGGTVKKTDAASSGTAGSGTGRTPSGPAASGEPKAGVYQNADLLAVVNDSCAKCHGATSKYTKLVTADGKSLNDLPAGKVWECFGLVNSGEMPKGGKAIGDDKVKLFYDWAKNARKSNEKVSLSPPGAPGNRDRDGPGRSRALEWCGTLQPSSDRHPERAADRDCAAIHRPAADRRHESATDRRLAVAGHRRAATASDRRLAAAGHHRAATASDRRLAAASRRRAATASDRRLAADYGGSDKQLHQWERDRGSDRVESDDRDHSDSARRDAHVSTTSRNPASRLPSGTVM